MANRNKINKIRKGGFIKCGFEFTAARKMGELPKGKYFNSDLDYDSVELETWDVEDWKEITPYKWIIDNYYSDDCGCEVATPIVKSRKNVESFFNEFKSFVTKSNLTLNSDKANNLLGGCHIHMDLAKFVTVNKKTLFLRNIAIFMTNNPQLNWGFNDLEDNINANSLFYGYEPKPTIFSNYRDYGLLNNLNIPHKHTNDNNVIKKNSPYYKFRYEKYPYNAFIHNPLDVTLYKRYAIRYNSEYNTIEFRIFGMPKTLNQHVLHYDVARAIYLYCEDATLKGKRLKLIVDKETKYTLEESLDRFLNCMKTLKINKNRVGQMIKNIKARYEWDGYENENYLL